MKAGIFIILLNLIAVISYGQSASPSFDEMDKRLEKPELSKKDTFTFEALAKQYTRSWLASSQAYAEAEDPAIKDRILKSMEGMTSASVQLPMLDTNISKLASVVDVIDLMISKDGLDVNKLSFIKSADYFRSVSIDNRIIIHYDLVRIDKSFSDEVEAIWGLVISGIEFID